MVTQLNIPQACLQALQHNGDLSLDDDFKSARSPPVARYQEYSARELRSSLEPQVPQTPVTRGTVSRGFSSQTYGAGHKLNPGNSDGDAQEPGEVQVMETRRVLGEEHPDALTGRANLASYQHQGRLSEAEKITLPQPPTLHGTGSHKFVLEPKHWTQPKNYFQSEFDPPWRLDDIVVLVGGDEKHMQKVHRLEMRIVWIT